MLLSQPNHGKKKGGYNMNWAYTTLWGVLMVVFLVVEAACPIHLVSIWFAVGSLVASIVAALGGQLWLQVLLFVVVSCGLLAALWPFVKKVLKLRQVHTNADSLIGQVGVVVADSVDGEITSGRVLVSSQEWAACTEDGMALRKGDRVLVKKIEGVRLVVEII
jgi:membrane protein implicated in regulation of membrane protease activity